MSIGDQCATDPPIVPQQQNGMVAAISHSLKSQTGLRSEKKMKSRPHDPKAYRI